MYYDKYKNWQKISFRLNDVLILNYYRQDLEKQDGCGGARENPWATCHDRVTPSKTKKFSNLPAFLDLYGIRKFACLYRNIKILITLIILMLRFATDLRSKHEGVRNKAAKDLYT